MAQERPLPRISGPFDAALELAGIRTLEDAATWTERDLLALHGVGRKGIGILREALTHAGLTFRSPGRDGPDPRR